MSKILLFFTALIFGVIVYLMVFRRMILWPLFIPLFIVVAVWYVVTFMVTKKMAASKFPSMVFFKRAKMLNSTKTDMTHGAFVVADQMAFFVKRKSEKGSVEIIWSAPLDAISSCVFEKVDTSHSGFTVVEKDESAYSFISMSAKKNESSILESLNLKIPLAGE